MERQLHPGQLSRAEFSAATPADDAGIRALLASVPMTGEWKIGFAREPSFFACPAPAGIEEHTLVARVDGRVISVGSWSEREVWLRGETARVGYLHGLRMAPGTDRSMRVLRDGYSALTERLGTSSAVGWFTSIDAANGRARRVLESTRIGLPRYRMFGSYRTRLLPVSRRSSSDESGMIDEHDELTEFLNRVARRHDLALTWNAARWAGGIRPSDCRVVRRRGRIVAAAGVWDQSDWKQVMIHGIPRWMKVLRPCLAMAAAGFGLPRPPVAGSRLAMAHVFPFAVEPGENGALSELWSHLERAARRKGIERLALGLDAADPLWKSAELRRMGVDYRTNLYQVMGKGMPEAPLVCGDMLLRPECAIL